MKENRCLKVATFHTFPYAMIIPGEKPGEVRFTGLVIDIINILTQHLGLCFEYIVSPNKSYVELIRMLNRSEADLGGVLLSVTQERRLLVDFSESLYIDETSLVNKRPVVTSDITGFVKPFTGQIWLLIFFSCLALFLGTSLIMRASDLVESPSNRNSATKLNNKANGSVSLYKCVHIASMWIVESLLGQSSSWNPEGNSIKVVAGVWLLVSLIITSVYKSNLKAMLIIPKIAIPFNSLEELVETNIPCYVISSSALYSSILEAPRTTALGKMQKNVVAHDNQNTAILEILQGKYAGAALRSGVLSVMHRDFSMDGKCDLYMVPRGFLGPVALSLAFPKNSTFKPKMDFALRRMKESGILDRVMETLLPNATECLKPLTSAASSNDLRPLDIVDFYGVFLLYLSCTAIASIAFLLELIFGPSKLKGRKH